MGLWSLMQNVAAAWNPNQNTIKVSKKMSQDQLNGFVEALKADSSQLDKVNSAKDTDAVLAIAKDLGFSITAEELENLIEKNMDDSEVELTVEQLEAVAGGAGFFGALAGMGAFVIGMAAGTTYKGIKKANE